LLYLAVGKMDKVSYHFDEALKTRARLTQREKLYVEGWAANRRGSTEEMVRAWSLMSTIYPENSSAHHNLGMVLWLFRNDFAAAATAFGNAGNSWAIRQRGYCRLALNDFDGAMEDFKASQRIDGTIDGLIYKERYPEALQLFDSQGDPAPLLGRKVVYYADQGKFQQAVEVARQAVSLGEGEPLSDQVALLVSLEQVGERTEFLQALRKSIEFARTTLEVEGSTNRIITPIPDLAIFGKMSARYGDIEQAEALHQLIRPPAEASGIELWNSYTKLLLGEIWLARKETSRAVDLLEEAVAEQESFQARESLAYALVERGDTERALQEYLWLSNQRARVFAECVDMCAIRIDNIVKWSLAQLRAAQLLEASGRPEEARGFYLRFVEQWKDGDHLPAWQEAKRRLEDLGSGS